MEKRNIYKIVLPLLFWGGYSIGFYEIKKAYGADDIIPYKLLVTIAAQVFLVYLISIYLFQWYFRKMKQITFYIISIALIIYVIPIIHLVALLSFRINVTFSRLFNTDLLIIYFITFILIFISTAVRIIKEREKEKREINDIERQKREIELFALKNQIDSHFLFNTLNNLYGLALKKSDLAPKGIMLLSEILSFVLYETKKDFYPLSNEVQLINNYFELEKLRWGDDISIDFEVNGNLKNSFITPLILFTFVENSFKHGVSKIADNPWIKIKLSTKANEIFFEIENCIPENSGGKLNQRNDGIGLENIKRRLNLLYPNMHYITTKMNEKSFYVRLTLTNN